MNLGEELMTTQRRRITGALLLGGLLALLIPMIAPAQGMFDSKPGKLPWKIAFQRDKNIWLMNADGSNQKQWRPLGNAAGKMAFSPDGRILAWSRQGEFTYKLPDGGGGGRRLYDLFQAEVDSTRDAYWRWLTFNHGSRAPEFSPDGQRVLYTYDMSANTVDAELPDFQIVHSRLDGSDLVKLARTGSKPGECQGMDPTWSPDGWPRKRTTRLRTCFTRRCEIWWGRTSSRPDRWSHPIGYGLTSRTMLLCLRWKSAKLKIW
jgi:dipeptidyl aminopeptidase/acylaminoacyl peptidase